MGLQVEIAFHLPVAVELYAYPWTVLLLGHAVIELFTLHSSLLLWSVVQRQHWERFVLKKWMDEWRVVNVSTSSTEILVSKAVLQYKAIGLLREMADVGIEQEMYKMSLTRDAAPESKYEQIG